jgi:hypothetical protein
VRIADEFDLLAAGVTDGAGDRFGVGVEVDHDPVHGVRKCRCPCRALASMSCPDIDPDIRSGSLQDFGP